MLCTVLNLRPRNTGKVVIEVGVHYKQASRSDEVKHLCEPQKTVCTMSSPKREGLHLIHCSLLRLMVENAEMCILEMGLPDRNLSGKHSSNHMSWQPRNCQAASLCTVPEILACQGRQRVTHMQIHFIVSRAGVVDSADGIVVDHSSLVALLQWKPSGNNGILLPTVNQLLDRVHGACKSRPGCSVTLNNLGLLYPGGLSRCSASTKKVSHSLR